MRPYLFFCVILILIGLILGVTAYGLTNMPERAEDGNVISSEIDRVDIISPLEVHLRLGQMTYVPGFDSCKIIITAPGDIEISEFELVSDKWSYFLRGERLSVTTLTVLDSDHDCCLDPGDSFAIYHIDDLILGNWTFQILIDGTDMPFVQEIFVIPDISTTPAGEFSGSQLVSTSKMRISYGSFDLKLPYYHTSVKVTLPGEDHSLVWTITQDEPYLFAYNDTIWIRIDDVGDKKVINELDAIEIQSTMGPLTPGEWTVSLIYDYTGEEICQISVEVPPE